MHSAQVRPKIYIFGLLVLLIAVRDACGDCVSFFSREPNVLCSGKGICMNVTSGESITQFALGASSNESICACSAGWVGSSHFFDVSRSDCITHQPTFIGLNYAAYVICIIAIAMMLIRLVTLRPLFSTASPGWERRRQPQRIILSILVCMIFSFIHLESVLFWDGLIWNSSVTMIASVLAGFAASLQAYLNLVWLGQIALTTTRAKAAEFKTKLLRIVVIVQQVVVGLLVAIPLIGVRAAASQSAKLAFAHSFYAAFCIQFLSGGIIGIYYTTVILNGIRKHVNEGKSGLSVADMTAVEQAAKRIGNVRTAFGFLFVFLIYAAITAGIPTIMTYFLPITYLQMGLVNVSAFRELRPGNAASNKPPQTNTPSSIST